VVTGGGRGIGLAIATALADCGARISIVSRSVSASSHDSVSASSDNRVTLSLSTGGEASAFWAPCDVTIEAEVTQALAASRAANGPIGILINNAGIAESAPVTRTSTALWDRIIATNLTGTFLCTRDAVEDMLIAKWGRILNVASTAGLGGAAYISAYCASKHGVVGFTRAIAVEFAPAGITANALCPGYTETEMMRKAMANIVKFTGASEEQARRKLAETNPGGRIATVEEVAQGALALLEGSRNGAAMIVPGGAYV
jgi:3-hydroxybutyrate dehydrogenase